MVEETPDRDRAEDRITERKNERAQTTESILERAEADLGEMEYPVTGEELSREYATDPIDLPNETESLGSVFDRLADEQFTGAEEVREAVSGESTGEAGDRHEANPERDLETLDDRNR